MSAKYMPSRKMRGDEQNKILLCKEERFVKDEVDRQEHNPIHVQ